MAFEIRDYKVNALPSRGKPNARYYVLNADGSVDEYVTDLNGNFRRVSGTLNVSADSTSANVGTLVFSNTNNISFGLSGSTITASVAPGGGGGFILSNSNGISFGTAGTVVTASYNSTQFLGTGYTTHTHSQYINTSQSTLFLTSQSVQPVAISGSNGSFTFSTVSFGNLNGLSFYSSNGSIVGSYTVPTDYVNTSQSSLFQQTSAMSNFLGTTYTTHTHSEYVNTSQSSLFEQTSHTTVFLTSQSAQAFSAQGGSSTFQTLIFTNQGGVSFTNTAGSVGASVRTDYASSDHSHGNPTLALTNLTGTTASASSGLTISLSAAAQSAQTGISSVALSDTTYTSGQISFRDGSGISWASTTGQGISISHALQFTSNTSAITSNALNTSQSSLFQHTSATSAITSNALNTSQSSLFQHTSATSAITSNALNTSAARIQALIASNTTYTSGSVGFRDTNGISWQSTTGQSIQITHALQFTSNTSAITSNALNTSVARIQGIIGSNTTYTSGSVGLRDLNGITWQSTTGQSFQITHDLQFTSATSAITSNALNTSASRVINIIAATNSTGGGTASLSSNVSFSNANNFTFFTSAGSAIVASYSQSIDTGKAGTGFTSAGANISLSGTLNTNGLSLSASVASQSNQAFSAAGGSSAFQTLSFADTNQVSFTNTNGSVGVASIKLSMFAVSNTTQSTVGTANHTALSFGGAGIASVGITGGSVVISVPAGAGQTGISGIILSNTTYTSGTVSFRDGSGISWASTTGQGISISHDLQFTSATSAITSNALNTSASRVINIVAATNSTGGGTASLSSNVSFSATNGVTFYTSAGGAIVGSVVTSYRASNDAIGLNTAQTNVTWTVNSSGLSLNAAGYAGTGFTSAGANISLSGTLNTAGLSLSASVAAPGAAAEANAINLLGANTAGNTTATGSTIGWSGINLTLSGTNNSVINVSAPATSSLSGTGKVSISVNASTISIGVPNDVTMSSYENMNNGLVGATALTWNGVSVSHAQAFIVPQNLSFSFLRIPITVSSTSTTIATIASATASAQGMIMSTVNAVIYSLGTGANSQSLQSVISSSAGFTFSQKISVSNSTQGSYSLGITGQANGALTSLSTQYSVSNTNYSFTTNAFSAFSGARMLDIPFASSLSAGAYWLVIGMSSSSSTAGNANLTNLTNCHFKYGSHYGVSNTALSFGIMGSTNTQSGGLMGNGSFSTAGGGTTNSINISAISSMAVNNRIYFQLLRSA